MPESGDLVHLAGEPSWDLYRVLGLLRRRRLIRLRHVLNGCLRVVGSQEVRVVIRGRHLRWLLICLGQEGRR